jgi:hypothetical protein
MNLKNAMTKECPDRDWTKCKGTKGRVLKKKPRSYFFFSYSRRKLKHCPLSRMCFVKENTLERLRTCNKRLPCDFLQDSWQQQQHSFSPSWSTVLLTNENQKKSLTLLQLVLTCLLCLILQSSGLKSQH